MNACLPLFINEEHGARVVSQIKPLLGFFFTLDPLGYKGDHLLALHGILGQLLCMRSHGDAGASSFTSEWADFLIEDLTKLCHAIRPKALKYLNAGGYTGEPRGDLLRDFLDAAKPEARTKKSIPNLQVLVGWHAVDVYMRTRAAPGHETPLDAHVDERFRWMFTEECWRRSLGLFYKAKPVELHASRLSAMLYGAPAGEPADELVEATAATAGAPSGPPGATADDADAREGGGAAADDNALGKKQALTKGTAAGASSAAQRKSAKEFEEFAEYKLGLLSKAKTSQLKVILHPR